MRRAALLALLCLSAMPARAQDHPAVQRLRGLLSAQVTLAYHAASPVEGAPEAVRLSGVTLTRGNETVSIATLLLDRLSETGAARVEADGLQGNMASGPLRATNFRLAGLAYTPAPGGAPPLPDAFTLEEITLEGLEVGGPANVTIRRLAIRDYGTGRRTRAEVEGLSVLGIPASPVSDVAIARIATEGLDLATWFTAAVRQEPPPGLHPGQAGLVVEGVELSAAGAVLGGLERFSAEVTAEPDQSGTAAIGLRGLRVEPGPGTQPFLSMLELPRLDASLTLDADYRSATGRLTIPAFAIGVQQLGATAIALTMDGWTPEAARQQDTSRVRLGAFRLRQVDDGLYERVLRTQAARQGSTPERIRQMHAQMAQATLSAPKGEPAGLASLREAVLRFIRGEARTIEVTASPETPVPMPRIEAAGPQGPAAMTRLLNLSGSNP